jgi:cyclopropane-fatty-acyl-phospholipid synthase
MFAHDLQTAVAEGVLNLCIGDDQPSSALIERPNKSCLAVRLRDGETLNRILEDPLLAVGEAYMDGSLTIEGGEIYDLLYLATQRLHMPSPPSQTPAPISKRNARRHVAHHYDLSAEFYRLFLDADQQYSCAYFTHEGLSLEEAQTAKKGHLAAKLLLQPDQSVLDIGSGWGGLGLTLAEEFGSRVTGITLSAEQLRASLARAADRGISHRVNFELKDYRDIDGQFDRIVSVGMFEHVGPAHYEMFFRTIAARLKRSGLALIHTIGSTLGPRPNNPWIDKYIFPGGAIPSLSQIVTAIERSNLVICDIEVLRLHYAETLRAWRERFAQNRMQVAALFDERFCRMWEFYLAGSEASFRAGDLVVFQIQVAKDQTAAPITRDYITDLDRAQPRHKIAAE